jgi:hypothetical protein
MQSSKDSVQDKQCWGENPTLLKRLAVSEAGMSLAGNNLIIPDQGEFG